MKRSNSKGKTLRNLGKLQESVDYFERILSKDPADHQAITNKGISLYYSGRYFDALKAFDAALKIEPQNQHALIYKAIIKEVIGYNQEAVDCICRVAEITPRFLNSDNPSGSVDELISMGETLCVEFINKKQEAIKFFDAALKIDPKISHAWVRKGICMFSLGHRVDAISCFDMAEKVAPNSTFVLGMKATFLASMKVNDDAINYFERSLKFEAKNLASLTNKGVLLGRLGKTTEANICFSEAVRVEPRSTVYVLCKKATAFGSSSESTKFLDMALEIEPDNVLALDQRGFIDECFGFGRASEFYLLRDQKMPKFFDQLLDIGNSNIKNGDYHKAIRLFDAAFEIDSKDPYVFAHKGFALDCLGKYEEAIVCYDEALKMISQSTQYSDLVVWIQNGKGLVYDHLGRYEQAIACYDEALGSDPNYVNSLVSKGIILSKLGKNEEAVKLYDKALELEPGYSYAMLHRRIAIQNATIKKRTRKNNLKKTKKRGEFKKNLVLTDTA